MVSLRMVVTIKIPEFPSGRESVVVFSKLLLQPSAQGEQLKREGGCIIKPKKPNVSNELSRAAVCT